MHPIHRLLLFLAFLVAAPLQLSAAETPERIDPELLAGMAARSIGPAAMSGRVAAVEALVSRPATIYAGAATGGLWRSVDDGLTWEPLFDDQPVAAIGAVAVDQRSPEIVWVGTGEGNPRNSASVGNGVYRSLDGGATWTHLGLEKSERIHRIVLHPDDPRVAWVAALGPTWGDGGERGVYKTTDGGASWRRVLSTNETTGAADLVIDPTNPQKLFAALWDHRRWPWFFRSGGPGSGLFVSLDGGETWTRRTPEDGLPEGELGRIGLAVAPSDPSVVYAFVEAEGDEHLLLRSSDGGRSFERRAGSAEQPVGNRPFYYADLVVDPQDPNRVYSLWSLVSLSEDGGKSWRVIVPFREVHPDHHALWIDPNDPDHLINGNDGGVYVSRDRGETWRFARTLPLAQFYHLRVDDDTPYHVYGGLQDNGSWRGPSEVWENGGIRDQHWQEVFFGDGFDTVPDPEDSTRGWAMSQEGYLARWDVETGERELVRPGTPYCPPGADPDASAAEGEGERCRELRFNWNAGLAVDPFAPGTIYFGSQYVHKSDDRGDSWSVISPDLTTDREEWQRQGESGGLTLDVTGAENFVSIVAIAPSALERGLIWVGTDDGRLHLTRDGGASWTSVEGNVPGVPANTWIPHIEPSRHDPAEAFVVFDDHRRSNWTPYVYRTRDYGASWTSIAGDELSGYALAVVQDPVERDLLYLGTEFGLWISLDGGGEWLRFDHGVPTVSVMDLALQERHDDLVIGTHGRGIFVLDELAPLRELSSELLAAPLHLFDVPDAQQYRVAQTGGARFPGFAEFRGENPPYGALITVSLAGDQLPHPDETRERERKAARRRAELEPERPIDTEAEKIPARRRAREAEKESAEEAGEQEREEAEDETAAESEEGPKLEVEIADEEGETLRTFEHPVHQGINRFAWDLRRDAFARPPSEDEGAFGGPERGPEVPPGVYTATVRFGGHEASRTFEVLPDPRFSIDAEARRARWRAELRLGEIQELAVAALERLDRLEKDLAAIVERGDDEEPEDGGVADAGAEDAGAEGAGEAKTQRERLREAAKPLEERAAELERLLRTPPEAKGIGPDTDVWSAIGTARWFLRSAWDEPSTAQLAYVARAERRLRSALGAVDSFFAEDVPAFRRSVEQEGIGLLPDQQPLAGALDP